MPHALPRELPFDFYNSSARSLSKPSDSAMQLPMPRMPTSHDHMPRALLTPPDLSGSAVRLVSLAPTQGAGLQYGYQLPAIGNSTSATTATQTPGPSQHQLHQPAREVAQTPRKKWSISPNLRIPPTINTPQEGLPQLAAEITCLFWFESSTTLKQVLDVHSSPQTIQPLVPDAHPTIGFKKWVATILTTTQVAQNVILLALLFIYRLKLTNPTVKGKPGSEYRLLTVALMLGNKFLDDNTYTNKTWAEVSGISVQEVHIMEVEFLSNMRYSLFTSKQKWEEWHTILAKFGTFFDQASRVPTSSSMSPVGGLTSSLALPQSHVPSPPTASQTSPPTSIMYSPNQSTFSNTPLLQPQPTSATVSPIGALPELGPIVRKRSADHSADQPMKRQAHGFAPGPYGNAPPIPTLQTSVNRSFELPPSVNRLPPLPSLSIPAPQQQQTQPAQAKTWTELSLPASAGRSMAMVYPPPVQWQQPLGTPTSMAAPPFASNYTPTSSTRQMSPYPPSASSSPVNAYPPSTSRQLSPSHLLNQRQSPYRPVRGVHTLLVPPPSTSMHNPAQNIGYNQMQYQPLGRPNTERRAGLLPYMDRNAWPEANQFNQLPIPQQPIFR